MIKIQKSVKYKQQKKNPAQKVLVIFCSAEQVLVSFFISVFIPSFIPSFIPIVFFYSRR